MHTLLLYTNNMDTFDSVAVKNGYAIFDDVDEETVTRSFKYPVTINGQEVNLEHSFDFLASTVKSWTLPRTVEVSVPVQVNGSGGNRIMDFVVDNLETSTDDRKNYISFTVNGQRVSRIPDNGGRQRVDAEGVRIYDFGGKGWPLNNIKAVYDGDTQLKAPEVLPGSLVVLQLFGTQYNDDVLDVSKITDPDVFDKSTLAKSFKDNGTERTYTRTATQTDWGEGYTLTYYEQNFGGDVIAVIDPNTLPEELIKQHGPLQRLTK